MVFDLDPGPGIGWDCDRDRAAAEKLLEANGYETWPKVTGGKGVHIMVPLEKR